MKKHLLAISILLAIVAKGVAQNGYVQPIPPPFADVVTDADLPGPRDLVAEHQIRDLIERSRMIGLDQAQERTDIEFLDNVFLAPDFVEIKPYGKFLRRAPGSSVFDPNVTSKAFNAVNVLVFGKHAFATYRATHRLIKPSANGQSTVYYRVLQVFQKREDHWQQVSSLSIQNIPVPGPDPWNLSGYWKPKAASVPPPPVVTANDALRPAAGDLASEQKIRSLLDRFFQSMTGNRSPAEVSADIEFDKTFEPNSMRILSSGKFGGSRGAGETRNVVYQMANTGRGGFATGRRFGVNVAVWGDFAIAVHQGSSVDWIYSLTVRMFEQHEGRWEQVVNSIWPLFPDPGPDPWGWIH